MKKRLGLILAVILCGAICLGGCSAQPPSDTDAPQATTPITNAPATDAPVTDAPATDAPVTDAPSPVDDPNTVYVDGTGKNADAYSDLLSAIKAIPEGGTVVICGDTAITEDITLSAGGPLVITSKSPTGDYTDNAALKLSGDITLGCAVTFKNITLDKTLHGNLYIVAMGNSLVIDEGVFCRNALASNYISLVGGAMSGTFEGNSDLTVKSGYFRNIFGGNYNGTFKGNSNISFLGGAVDNMVAGGTFMGNFEGDSHVNVGGDAVVVYLDSGSGVMGSCCGSGNEKYTFKGDIYISVYGKARINQSLYGTTKFANVTTTGNVNITVKDDAFIYQNLYAGGYNGMLNGNTHVVMDGGWVGVNLAAGSRGGTVKGDTYLEVNAGQINYYFTNMHSSYSNPAGEYNVAGGGLTGMVMGNTTVVINGGDIYGHVYGGGITTGVVRGSSSVTVKGGSIACGVTADGFTKGSVKGTKTLNIDISGGRKLSLGLSAEADTFTGGGTLTLFPEATVSAKTVSGETNLIINGDPLDRAYVIAEKSDGAKISYTPKAGEKLEEKTENGKTSYVISLEKSFATTKLTFRHSANAQIYLRPGLVTSGAKLTADEISGGTTVFNVEPGLYNYVVYHSEKDYKRKYVYVTGKEESMVFDHSVYLPKSGNGFEAANHAENSELIEKLHYNNEKLEGFKIFDTPYFANNRYGTRQFTTNAEMLDFIKTKTSSCAYAYTYDLFTSPGGVTVPVVIFTKDAIPANATLEEAAAIIGAKAGRDVFMVTGFVHGNEPSGGEGALALISEMCGEYGSSLLKGNVGAVVIVPRLNPDGSKSFTRNTPNGNLNLNRDYAILQSAEIRGVVKAFDLFEPTILIDCHEAPLEPKYGDSYMLTDVYDVGLMCAGVLNTPFVNGEAVIKGEYTERGMRSAELVTEVLKNVEKTGLRGYYYQTPQTSLTANSVYGIVNGAYSFILEIPGITGGDYVFARRVFSQVTAVKEIFALAASSEGRLAKEVNEARTALALSAQKYDENRPVVLKHGYTRNDASTLLWNNPLVAADGTVRRAENITKYYIQDVAVKYRSVPTAYVIDASARGVNKVLDILEGQGIAYYKLDNGTSLTLKRYSGTKDTAKLGDAATVTFAGGAYIVPVDGYKAYLTATLFEPENGDSTESAASFVQAGYIAADAVYRSEESFIAAKLGLEGTYLMIEIPEGKTVASAKVDGKSYASVDTEGTMAFVVASESKEYSVELTFADGTSQTFSIK